MTPAERAETLETVTEAVLQCPTLKLLNLAIRLEAANLIRRDVASKLPAATDVPLPA